MTDRELKKILYAEDDPSIQAIVEIALKDLANFELKICDTGKEALDSISEFEPDLVLTDVTMPDMDGPELLKAIKCNEEYSDLPVIFMTAKVQSHEHDAYLQLGVTKVIVKPFDPIALPNEIREAWDSAQNN